MGEHEDRPYFRQFHTLSGDRSFIYYHKPYGNWRVSEKVGQDVAGLVNIDDSGPGSIPPTSGWVYGDADEWRSDDDSLQVVPSPVELCGDVVISSTLTAEIVRDRVGTYRPTGDWSVGREVFYNSDKKKYLRMRYEYGTWGVYDTLDGEYAYIFSASGTVCPCDPKAKQSDLDKLENWVYADNGEWKESEDIEIECKKSD